MPLRVAIVTRLSGVAKVSGSRLRQRTFHVPARSTDRGLRDIATAQPSGRRHDGERSIHVSRAWQGGQVDRSPSELGVHHDRRSEADFRAALRDFLYHSHDGYEIGSHEGRASINLRSPSPTSQVQIQKRLAFFFDVLTGGESLCGEFPTTMEMAKNVYIQLTGRMGSNVSVTIEFDRTAAGNSLDSATLESLASVFEGLHAVSALRGVLLTGAAGQKPARAFSCGADVKEMQQLGNANEATSFIKRISRVCTAVRQLQVPVICGIDGTALGAGLEIAASCDIRVATRQSMFGMPEVNLAIPSVVEARLLCDIIGVGRTKHFLLTGETINADTALNYGLVTKLFDDRAQLMSWSANLLGACCSSLKVHSEQKALMRIWESSNVEEGISAGVGAFADRFEGSLGKNVRSHMQLQWQKLKSARK